MDILKQTKLADRTVGLHDQSVAKPTQPKHYISGWRHLKVLNHVKYHNKIL